MDNKQYVFLVLSILLVEVLVREGGTLEVSWKQPTGQRHAN